MDIDEQWVVDSLIGFLQSPEWTSPINNFIDENCVVFDPGEENKFSYTDVHNHYNKLVDQLLSQFTADLGITVDQLADACVKSSTLGAAYQKLLEQVSATEDFVLFKSIMVQKNIDLEYQALKLLKSQLGHAPDIYDPNKPTFPLPVDIHFKKNEDNAFQQALEESRREFETQKSLDEEEMKKLIDLATKESLLLEASKQSVDSSISIAHDESQLDLKSATPSAKKLEKVGTSPEVLEKSCSDEKKTFQKQLPESKQQAHLVPLSPEHKISTSTSEAACQWIQCAKKEYEQHADTIFPQNKVTEKTQPDIQSRESYLKRQRDHLLKSKRQARAKELDHYNTTKAPIVKKANLPQQTSASDDTKSAGASEEKFFTGVLCSAIAHKLKTSNNL